MKNQKIVHNFHSLFQILHTSLIYDFNVFFTHPHLCTSTCLESDFKNHGFDAYM